MSKLQENRKRKTKDPCSGCFLHKNLCMCELIPRLNLKTKLNLVIHHKELKRTSNTGRLAINSLVNSKMYIRGMHNSPLDLSSLLKPELETLLLFPSDDAEVLTSELVDSIGKNIQLIVPDGNWRQASKVNTRHQELNGIRRVKVKRDSKIPDPYLLRSESTEDGMATLQAIAFAMGAIEGSDIKNQLLKLYDEKLVRTLVARGELPMSSIKSL